VRNHSIHWITRLVANTGLRGDVCLYLVSYRASELNALVSGRRNYDARRFAFDQARSDTSARSNRPASAARTVALKDAIAIALQYHPVAVQGNCETWASESSRHARVGYDVRSSTDSSKGYSETRKTLASLSGLIAVSII
jgi:hypothetical protein